MRKHGIGAWRGALWLACACLLLATHAGAAVLQPVDARELVDAAELIFTGIAVDRQVATSRDGRYPYTFYTFQVERVIKGRVAGDQITLRFEGGEIGDELIEVLGMPAFERNGHYLLFVADNGRAISPVVGWQQGRFELVDHPSQPGRKVILDRNGMAIEGVGNEAFVRSRVERDGRSVRRALSADLGFVVLEEDGIEVTDPLAPDLAKASEELMPAWMVLDSLQRSVGNRTRVEGFRPGALVRSLTIDDVPDRFSLHGEDAARSEEGGIR